MTTSICVSYVSSVVVESSAADADTTALTPQELAEAKDTLALRELKTMSHKMAEHFSFGFRFIFMAIPFWLYAAGPVALVVATGVLLSFLIVFDFPKYRKDD
jgi:uncharacterized membrane protein